MVPTLNSKQCNLQEKTFSGVAVTNRNQHLKGLHFFPAKGLSKKLLPQVSEAVSNGLKICVCLSKNIKVPKVCGGEIRRRNIVMGDVECYRKMMSGTRKTWL